MHAPCHVDVEIGFGVALLRFFNIAKVCLGNLTVECGFSNLSRPGLVIISDYLFAQWIMGRGLNAGSEKRFVVIGWQASKSGLMFATWV